MIILKRLKVQLDPVPAQAGLGPANQNEANDDHQQRSNDDEHVVHN